MEHIDLAKYTKADGQIDYDTLLTDKMSDGLKQTIIKLEQNNAVGDGIIRNTELLTKYDNRNKKEAFVVVSMEKDREKEEERFLKRIEREERELQREQDLKDTKKTIVPPSTPEHKRETLDDLVKEDPLLVNSIINFSPNRKLEQFGQTHTINVLPIISRYGKETTLITPNNRISFYISRQNQINFGCIQDFEIDTIPLSMFRGKGMEKFALYEQEKQNRKGQFFISRRFVSKLISFWGYMMDIQYVRMDDQDTHTTAISIWGNAEKFYGLDNKKMQQYFGYGDICIPIIKDILFMIRNKPFKEDSVSPQFLQVIAMKKKAYQTIKQKFNLGEYLSEIKKRLYYDYQLNSDAWATPKLNPEYLIGLLNELQSNKYVLTQQVPLIYDLWNFPIKCTDMNLKPMTNEQHEANKDDYDISAIVFERD